MKTYSKEIVFPGKFTSEVIRDGVCSKITISPMQPGFGHTIGNSLRRILLSAISGVAISEVTIENIDHDFSVIPGVQQDVPEIIYNLRKVIIKSKSDSGILKLNITGPKKVLAKDIEQASDIEIINPDHFLFEVSAGSSVSMQMKFISGVGDYFIDENEPQTLGVIKLDRHFSPVTNVSFTVSDTRVNKRTDYDKLTLTIETNGSITPEESMSAACSVMFGFLTAITEVNRDIFASQVASDSIFPEKKPKDFNLNLLRRIDELDLSVRSFNCLKNDNVVYVGDLVSRSEYDMLRTPNFGRKSLNEIKQVLTNMGLHLGMDIKWPPEDFDNLLREVKRRFDGR